MEMRRGTLDPEAVWSEDDVLRPDTEARAEDDDGIAFSGFRF